MQDGTQFSTRNYFANTQGQTLGQHLFAVGYVAYRIIQNCNLYEDDKLSRAVFVTGCLHDIGKTDPAFQSWISSELKKKKQYEIKDDGQHIEKKSGKFSFETHPRHNEISLLLYQLLNDDAYKRINKRNKDSIKHGIYWHHAKPIRKEDFQNTETIYRKLKKNLGDTDFSALLKEFTQTVRSINACSKGYFSASEMVIEGFHETVDEDRFHDLRNTSIPAYKYYSDANDDISDYLQDINENAQNNLVRAAVITADRLISALSAKDLSQYLEDKNLDKLIDEVFVKDSDLGLAIHDCLDGFECRYPDSERNQRQTIAAKELAEKEVQVGVLSGPAGCGKTKIALEWAAQTDVKKIIWICPRVQVCQGLFHDLSSPEYLPNVKIEINTGEFKQIHQSGEITDTPEGQEFSGDIVITTIDQITNAIITHQGITSLVMYMKSHVVFDEYHEYINMPAFNLLFAELVECKKLQGQKAKALLVSATPNYFFLEELLGVDQRDIIGIESFNKSQYQIRFTSFNEEKQDDTNPFFQSQPKNTFVISNTAITAQQAFIANQKNENAILFHGKFKKSDKQDLFYRVLNSFKENGNRQYDILRSGPIVQASLNISCDKMITEFTHAENWLQRLGRLDRFGKNKQINSYNTAIPETIVNGGQTGKCARFLNSLHCLQSAKSWHTFLQHELSDEPVTINHVYRLYRQFYQDGTHREAIEEDLKKALKKSVEVINAKLLDPFTMPNKKHKKNGVVKIKRVSLRGDNRFVQMAICRVKARTELEFPDEYAYSETEGEDILTYSTEVICGYGVSERNLLAFMAKKHHNIKDTKKAYKDNFLLNEARNPETPIYLSYIPADLKRVEAQQHPYAIYYAVGINQPIGAIQLEKLDNLGE